MSDWGLLMEYEGISRRIGLIVEAIMKCKQFNKEMMEEGG